MITCYRCGEQNPYDSKFCSNCGYDLATQKETKKSYNHRDSPLIKCPMCGAEGERNFSHIHTITEKNSFFTTGLFSQIKCKNCGYVKARQK